MDNMSGTGDAHQAGGKSHQDPADSSFMAHGKINRIDAEAGTVNITHGPIKALNWPGMTMGFRVADKALLKGLKAGDEVDFDLAKASAGNYVVIRISPSK
ncbi:MAG: copper-binding protein [Betaproteobacteria bacterium]|nr:copper-binding protein [Betaproteobacteria bacterium]